MAHATHPYSCACDRRDGTAVATAALSKLGLAIRGWLEWQNERQALLDLDTHLLKDIGVSRIEAERMESQKFTALKRLWP